MDSAEEKREMASKYLEDSLEKRALQGKETIRLWESLLGQTVFLFLGSSGFSQTRAALAKRINKHKGVNFPLEIHYEN